MISQRTIAGPATAKARGRKLGSSDSASPLSSRALAADTRAAAGAALEPQTPVSVRMASVVCARAKDRISAVALAI